MRKHEREKTCISQLEILGKNIVNKLKKQMNTKTQDNNTYKIQESGFLLGEAEME